MTEFEEIVAPMRDEFPWGDLLAPDPLADYPEADEDDYTLVDSIAAALFVLAKHWFQDGGDPDDVEGLADWLYEVGPYEISWPRCTDVADDFCSRLKDNPGP